MTNLNAVLNDRIARVARKEIKAQTNTTRRAAVRYRGEIAALKRQVAALQKTVSFLDGRERKRAAQEPAAAVGPESAGVRFRADGLKSHRAKLGLSAKDYGSLVGVAGLTIYQWESGKARPRRAQLAKLATVRGIGKREAMKRLEMLGVSRQRTRGSYDQTAEEFITSLVRGRKATTSSEINARWKAAGRPGKADNTLSRMVKAGALKRDKLKDDRGSKYRV
jgi:transcriptional regulator with XRE-family HTH domain